MAAKKYTAKSHVSLSVPMTDKKNARISFTPITGGGSVFYTSDERVQAALEQHPKFNKLFKEDMLYQAKKITAPAPKAQPKKKDITEVHVTCLDDAKDYLSDKFGVSRTKMRSMESIIKLAAANNIQFKGLEE